MAKRSNGTAPTNLKRPATLDRLQSKKAFRVFHPVILDNEAAIGLEAAQRALDEATAVFEAARARHLNYPANTEAQTAYEEARVVYSEAVEAYDAAHDAAEEATFTFVFKAVAPHEFDALSRAHPPTDEDKAKWAEAEMEEKDWPPTSPTTFPAAVIAACMVEPDMTEDQVRIEIWENDETWNEQEKMGLLQAAYSTNNRATVSLGKGRGRIRLAESSKPSSTATASPAASSTDG